VAIATPNARGAGPAGAAGAVEEQALTQGQSDREEQHPTPA
jgi:hypothetical protein